MQMLEHSIGGHSLAHAGDQSEAHFLSQAFVGNAERRSLEDRWVAVREVLEPSTMDIVAAADDEILLAADEAQAPTLVERAEVPGHEPAIPIEGFFRGDLVVEIAEHEQRAARPDLSDLAGTQLHLRVLLAEDPRLVAFRGAPAG